MLQVARAAVVPVALLVVGLVAFVFVRTHQGDVGAFADRQRGPTQLRAAQVEQVVRLAPDRPGGGRRYQALRASCRPNGTGQLRNPWACRLGYRSGRNIAYRVTVRANGSYIGDDQVTRYAGASTHGPGTISGCCIAVP